jgi:hypothetical protein
MPTAVAAARLVPDSVKRAPPGTPEALVVRGPERVGPGPQVVNDLVTFPACGPSDRRNLELDCCLFRRPDPAPVSPKVHIVVASLALDETKTRWRY